MTIGKKVGALSAVLVLFTVILAVTSLFAVSRLSGRIQLLQYDSIPGQYSVGRIEVYVNAVREKMDAEFLDLIQDPASATAQRQTATAAAEAKLQQEMKAYEKTITQAEDRQIFSTIGPAVERFSQSFNRIRAAAPTAKSGELVAQYRSEITPAFDALNVTVSRLVEWNLMAAKANADAAEAAVTTAKWWNWTLLPVSVLAGALLSALVVRSLNLELRRTAQDLSESAGQVASAASQLSSSSRSLAQGSSEQAASLEETSASSEEINSMARRNNENSRSAAALMAQSQQKFIQTNQALDQSVAAMGEIRTQSDKISKIIKTIDEIAFQTNILALNAAVEAARAGEAGMGFAVVADEVRNLAQRCAQAAEDTASLIEESIVKSNDGKAKVDEVANAIRAMTEEAGKVKTLVDEVNLGSQEQARGIAQIGKAITQMEQVTQGTVTHAEESASAAGELNAQSEMLKDIIERLTAMVGGGESSNGHGRRPAQRRASASSAGGRNARAIRRPA
jgi:methyl-accepting chemotaxis protein/methyl-accepting chemotaxis protein-1 (serine sensor receptor)